MVIVVEDEVVAGHNGFKSKFGADKILYMEATVSITQETL